MHRKNLWGIVICGSFILLLCVLCDYRKAILVIAVVTALTYAYCDAALQTRRPWNSDLLLEIYFSIKHYITDFQTAEIQDNVENSDTRLEKGNHGSTNTVANSTSSNLLNTDNDGEMQELQGQAEKFGVVENGSDCVQLEISKFMMFVSRDFIQSWYAGISDHPLGYTELESTLDSVMYNTLKHIEKVEKYTLIIKFIQLYQCHLTSIQRATSLCHEMASGTDSIDRVLEIYSETSKLHVASTDKQVEINYFRAVTRFLLIQLSSGDIDRCYPGLEALSEIITCNLLLPVIDMMCDTNWLHRMIIKIVSDEQIEACTLGDIENVTQDKIPPEENTDTLKTDIEDKPHCLGVKHDHMHCDLETNEHDEMFAKRGVSFGLCEIGDVSNTSDLNKSTPVLDSENYLIQTDLKFQADANCDIKKGGLVERSPVQHSYTSPNLNNYFLISSLSDDGFDTNFPFSDVNQHDAFDNKMSRENALASKNVLHNETRRSQSHPSDDVAPRSPFSKAKRSNNDVPRSPSGSYDNNTRRSPSLIDKLHHKPLWDEEVSPPSSPLFKIQHNVKSAYFSRLGLTSTSPPSRHSQTPDSCSLSSSVSSNNSIDHQEGSPGLDPVSPLDNYNNVQTGALPPPDVLPITMLKASRPVRKGSTSSNECFQNYENRRFSADGASLNSVHLSHTRPGVLEVQPVQPPIVKETNHSATLSQADSSILPQQAIDTVSPYDEVDIKAEYRKMTVPLKRATLQSQHSLNNTAPLNQANNMHTESAHQVTRLVKALPRQQSVPNLLSDVPRQLFKSVVISDSKEMREPNSTSTYVLYLIEYEAWYTEENGELVVGPGFAHRRYREFVNLNSRLEENPMYRKSLKGIKGPTKWFTFPLFDKAHVEKRKHDLQLYLQKLIEKDDMNCSSDLREFLAYGGDAHIAFVKKAPEINVPRLDKFVARKMTVVKDRLATALPTKPSDGSHGDKKPDKSLMVVEIQDKDELSMKFTYKDQQDIMESNDISVDKRLQGAHNDMSDSTKMGPRPQGDGSDNPDLEVPGGVIWDSTNPEHSDERHLQHTCDDKLPVVMAILDLVSQSANGGSPMVTDQVLDLFKVFAGKALECWLHKEIDELTTRDRCAYYMSLLRETIWPGGVLSSEDDQVKNDAQLLLTKEQAFRCLKEFFPDILPFLLEHDFDNCVQQVMSSIECPRLNRHFICCLIDLLLEEIFPEITLPNFGQVALLKDEYSTTRK